MPAVLARDRVQPRPRLPSATRGSEPRASARQATAVTGRPRAAAPWTRPPCADHTDRARPDQTSSPPPVSMAPPRGPDLLTGQGPGAPAPACTTVAEIGGEPHGEAATQPTQRPDARWVPTRGVPSAWPCRGLPPAVHRSVRARSATASTPGQPNGAGTGERLPVRHARLIRRVNRTGRPGLFWLLPGAQDHGYGCPSRAAARRSRPGRGSRP